jgi:hypothetical protein
VENLNCINSYAEGCDESGVNSPNGLSKDGFWFGTGRRTLIDGCTLKRFWVEGIAVFDNEPGLFVEKISIPEEGQVVDIPILRQTPANLLGLFRVGTAVYLTKRNGYYTVEKAGSNSLTLRRLPQPSPMVPVSEVGAEAVGVICKLAEGTADIVTRITACSFDGTPSPGNPDERNPLNPAIRIEAGQIVISENTFISPNVAFLALMDESSPYGQRASLISNNLIQDEGKNRNGKPIICQAATSIIGGTIEGNAFVIKKPDGRMDFTCLAVGWGAGGSSVLRGNVFRSEKITGGGKVSAINRNHRIGKMVADGNVFDGVDPGAVDDPSAIFEGKNIKLH